MQQYWIVVVYASDYVTTFRVNFEVTAREIAAWLKSKNIQLHVEVFRDDGWKAKAK